MIICTAQALRRLSTLICQRGTTLGLGLLGGVFILSTTAVAAPADYVIDDVHTNVDFEVAHLTFSTVRGSFRKFGGEVIFDQKKKEPLKVNAWVEVNSIDTRNEKRDTHLKSADFFDAQKYSKIILKSTSIKRESDNKFKMLADFTLHGVTKSVSFDLEYKGTINAFEKERIAYTATTKINRKDYGVSFSHLADSVPVVGDEVTLLIAGQAILKKDL